MELEDETTASIALELIERVDELYSLNELRGIFIIGNHDSEKTKLAKKLLLTIVFMVKKLNEVSDTEIRGHIFILEILREIIHRQTEEMCDEQTETSTETDVVCLELVKQTT